MATSPGSVVHELRQKVHELTSALAACEEQCQQGQGSREADAAAIQRENELKQSNYSLTLKLSANEQNLQFCSAEMESLQEQADKQRKELTQQQLMVEQLKEQNRSLKQRCESYEAEATTLKEQLSNAQLQLGQAKDELANVTLSVTHDDSELHSQIATLTCEKHELSQTLSQTLSRAQSERDTAQSQLSRCETMAKELAIELEDKNCKLTAYYNQVESMKEQLLEHEQELDLYKLNEKDPRAKGNSIFAEVEDNRIFLEKEVLKLRGYYQTVVKQYEIKIAHVSRLKLQVASLLSQSGAPSNGAYVQHLNDSLRVARAQIAALKEQCTSMETEARDGGNRPIIIQCQPSGCASRSSYMQKTFDANRTELSVVKGQLKDTRFHSTVLSDQILTLQRQLHSADFAVKKGKADVLKLSIQLQDVKSQKGIFAEPEVLKTWTETLPDFNEVNQVKEDNNKNSSSSNTNNIKDCNAQCASANLNITTQMNGEKNILPTPQRPPPPTITTPTAAKTTTPPTTTTTNPPSAASSAGAANREVSAPSGAMPSEMEDDVFEATKDGATDTKPVLGAPDCGEKENCPTNTTPDAPSTMNTKRVGSCLSNSDKRPKKSVRMQDLVDVHNIEGECSAVTLKTTDGSGTKLRRPLRKMQPVAPQALPDSLGECKQQ